MAATGEITRDAAGSRAPAYDGFMSYSHVSDDLLAPRLQAAVQRFAKPWWKRRAVRIFRDESSLSANPHLWSSITAALDGSEWFILLLSDEAARSEWVNREIEYWLAHKDPSRIIPVVTQGEFGWEHGDIAVSSTAAPPALSGAFREEPRWVDLRWARSDTDMDLSNPRFSSAVADIASAMRGVPKDELASEEVYQHRRTIRTAWAGGIALFVLGVAAAVAALIAIDQSSEAREQRDEASRQADLAREQAELAQDNAALAERNAELAEENAARAERNAALARSRELAASAINVLDDDPTLSKLLALAAADIADPPLESVSALHQAFGADKVVGRYSWPENVTRPFQLWTDVAPSGDHLVASGVFGVPSGHLEVVEIESGDVVWSFDVDHGEVAIDRPRYVAGGEAIVAGALWEAPGTSGPAPPSDELGVFVWDAATGELLAHYDFGECGATVADAAGSRALVKYLPPGLKSCWFPGQGVDVPLDLLDLDSGERRRLTGRARGRIGAVGGGSALSAGGRFVAFDDGERDRVVVGDLDEGARLGDLDLSGSPQEVRFVQAVADDGTFLVYGSRPMLVVDAASGAVTAEIEPRDLEAFVTLVGDSLYASSLGGSLQSFEARTGNELMTLPAIGSGNVSATADGLVLVSDGTAGGVLVDPDPRGEIVAVETCPGFTWAGSLTATIETATLLQICRGDRHGTTQAVALDARAVAYALPGGWGQQQPISPDGERFVRQAADDSMLGPLEVRDVRTGGLAVELQGICWWDQDIGATGQCTVGTEPPFAFWANRLRWSPDGTMIAGVSALFQGTGVILGVWDATTGELLFVETGDTELGNHVDAVFSPDSARLVASYWGPMFRMFSTDDWSVTAEAPIPESLTGTTGVDFAGYGEDGTMLIAVGGVARGVSSLHWLDATTLEQRFSLTDVHDASIRSHAMSRDRSLIATGSGDGTVRVWDAATGALVHEIPVGDLLVQGVAFVDDDHLAVAPQGGGLLVYTIDTDELLEIVRDSLSRGFTASECQKYNFGGDCPSLAELADGSRP